jgi:hypothetical protein
LSKERRLKPYQSKQEKNKSHQISKEHGLILLRKIFQKLSEAIKNINKILKIIIKSNRQTVLKK